MENKPMIINGIEYVPKDTTNQLAENVDNMPFVLIRGYGSGVQFGYMKKREGCEVELVNSRRIYYWNGATETNQITVSGISDEDSKVTVMVPFKIITDVIEVEYLTEEAAKNLKTTTIWKK